MIIQQLEAHILEHIHSLEDTVPLVENTSHNILMWKTLKLGTIKLNVDAALSKDRVVIAVVAQNSQGMLIKAWAKLTDTLEPTLAKAATINWALELAKEEEFKHICIESDAKVCVDALNSHSDAPWVIYAQSSYSLELALHFPFCSFNWVKQDANHMAQALAKEALSLCLPFSCNVDSLPPSVL